MSEDMIVLYYVEKFTQSELFRVFESPGLPSNITHSSNDRYAATPEDAVLLKIRGKEISLQQYQTAVDEIKSEIEYLQSLLPGLTKEQEAEEAGRRG